MVRPSHLRISHASPGLRGRLHGWWKSGAVSTQYGCASCRVCRFDSSEWPSRIVEGFIGVPRCICTSARRSCYSRNTWIGVKCEKDMPLATLPGEMVGDWARRLNKLIVYSLSRVKSITQTRISALPSIGGERCYFSEWHVRLCTFSQSIA